MTDTPENLNDQPSDQSVDADRLLKQLRRKEGVWVEWGQACQALQKAGYSPQAIFEDTGFEPIQQNQIIVAAQVYSSVAAADAPPEVLAHFGQRSSDILYELRILPQTDRASAATIVLEKGMDVDGAREIAKALKDFARLGASPENFTVYPGDAIAYHYWKLARHQRDLQSRSRLIAQGLRFAQSETARQQIERLLTDFTVVPQRSAPLWPIYRLESDTELPRILPVVGKLPLSTADLQAVPLLEEEGPFQMVKFSGTGAWMPVPGWQIIRNAEDPVVVLADSDQIGLPSGGKSEEVMVVVDRAQRQWNADAYWLADNAGQLHLQWFEDQPALPLLGQIILVMRPRKVLDEGFTKDPWQIDE